jgi:hypothetical protein
VGQKLCKLLGIVLVLLRWAMFCYFNETSFSIQHKSISGQYCLKKLELQVVCSSFPFYPPLAVVPHPLGLQCLQRLSLWGCKKNPQFFFICAANL